MADSLATLGKAMDDRSLQFLLFLAIGAAVLVLVVVGVDVVRRIVALYRGRALQRTRVAVKQELP